MDFHSLARKELQALCKKNKIPANMTNVAMADALAALETVHGVEEILVQTECDAQNSPARAAAITPRVPRTSVRRKTTKEEPENTKLRRGRKESVSDEGKNDLPDTPAATTVAHRSRRAVAVGSDQAKEELAQTPAATTVARRSRRAVAEGSDQPKEELAQTPAVVGTQRRKAAAVRSTRGKVQIDQVKEEEKVEVKGYNTCRSTRLLGKKMEDLTMKDGETSTDSRGKSVETDLEDAFNEKPEALAGGEEKNDVSGESKFALKEVVPIESEISTITVSQDEQGKDQEVVDIVPDKSFKRQVEQGTDSNSSVDVKEADSEKKYEAFEATDEGLEDSNDVSLDETPSEIGNDTKQSDHKDEGTPVEIDDLASLTSDLNLKEQQHAKDDTKGLATSPPSLEARASKVDQEEDSKTEASDISSVHDFEFASELHEELSEAQKTNGTEVKPECDLPNADAGMNVKDPDFVTSPFTKNEIETEDAGMIYSPEKAADAASKLLEVEGGSKTQMAETDASLDKENAEKIEGGEVAAHASESPVDDHSYSEIETEVTEMMYSPEKAADASSKLLAEVEDWSKTQMAETDASLDKENAEKIEGSEVAAHASESPVDDHSSSESEEENTDQADANEYGAAADLHTVDIIVDNELVSEEMLFGDVKIQSSDNMAVTEAKEASPAEAVPASCESYPLPEDNATPLKQMSHRPAGFDQEMTSELDSRDENIMMARRRELDHQVACLLLQPTPSKKTSSAQRMIHVFDDNDVSSVKKPELGTEKIIVANKGTPLEKKENKENNVSGAKKPELGTEKIIVANKGTPLEKKSMNYLKKMLKEKLQEEKVRPALHLISGNCPAHAETHSRELSS